MMSSSQYLSSDSSEQLPQSAFDSVDVPRIYNELGLKYEEYILEDAGRGKTIEWVISKILSKDSPNLNPNPNSTSNQNHSQGLYVVDLGCASGRPTVETIAQAIRDWSNKHNPPAHNPKHTVIGIDLSPTQLSHARTRISIHNPIAQFTEHDIRTWIPPPSYADAGVDAVLSHYVLNHLPPRDYEAVIARISQWLKPGGVLALGLIANVNGWVKWFGYDIAGYSVTLEETVRIVEVCGLRVERAWEEEWRSSTAVAARGKVNQFVLAVKI